jgi:hypothetical protein
LSQGSAPRRRLAILASRGGGPLAGESVSRRLATLAGGGGNLAPGESAPCYRLATLPGRGDVSSRKQVASRRERARGVCVDVLVDREFPSSSSSASFARAVSSSSSLSCSSSDVLGVLRPRPSAPCCLATLANGGGGPATGESPRRLGWRPRRWGVPVLLVASVRRICRVLLVRLVLLVLRRPRCPWSGSLFVALVVPGFLDGFVRPRRPPVARGGGAPVTRKCPVRFLPGSRAAAAFPSMEGLSVERVRRAP